MTTLLETKQKIKNFYGEHDTWILPLLKFLLAFLVFQSTNYIMGFFEALDNIFIVLILSLISAVLPINGMTILVCIAIVAHCYGVGIEVAGFAILLMILLMILFLRFTSRDNLALILTPAAFGLHIPAAIPIGAGLLRGPACAVPSCCGVILYYFMDTVRDRSTVLQGKETESLQKLQILLDALINNQEMAEYSCFCSSADGCVSDFQDLCRLFLEDRRCRRSDSLHTDHDLGRYVFEY